MEILGDPAARKEQNLPGMAVSDSLDSGRSCQGMWQSVESPSLAALVVSIHDVCPGTRKQTEKMLADLRKAGVDKTSLLVIPNRHKSDPSFEDTAESRDFCKWLLECRLQGHELVLHGYWHQRVATIPLHGVQRMIARHYTAGEGEFFDLNEPQSIAAIARGMNEMQQMLGITPSGFIAPAWLMGAPARRALAHFSFSYTTLLEGIWDLDLKAFYPSQSLCYSVRAPWRRTSSLLWNSALLAWLDDAAVVRIGLHPPDWDYPGIRSHALECAQRALVGRLPMTYESWVQGQRRRTSSLS